MYTCKGKREENCTKKQDLLGNFPPSFFGGKNVKNKRCAKLSYSAFLIKGHRSDNFERMAVLGIQFVITLMMATVLSRVGPHLSLAR